LRISEFEFRIKSQIQDLRINVSEIVNQKS
jgi:hypothetical protein